MTFRRAAYFLLVSIFLLEPAMASDWPMCRRDASQRGATEESLQLPLRLAWQYNAVRSQGNPSAPAVVGGVVYFASGDTFYAVDAETGALKWRYPEAPQVLPKLVRSSPAVVDGMVYFGCSDGNLYALNAADGKFLWAFATGGAVRSSPVVVNESLFIGSDDDCLYQLNARTGDNLWGLTGFRTRSDIPHAAAAAPGIVVFASMDLYVYGASQSTGRTLWAHRLIATASKSSPVISDNTVYIGAGSVVYGLMLRSGLQKMGIPLSADVAGSPAIDARDLYVVTRDQKLHAFTISGRIAKPKWQEPADLTLAPTCGPTVAGDAIYVAGERGVLAAFSAEDGSLLWRYVMAPSSVGGTTVDYTNAYSSPVVADGRLYVLTDDGALRCFTFDAADDVPPEIYNLVPRHSEEMSGSPPIQFSAHIFDIGSGLDPSSIQMLLDGMRVDHTFDGVKSLLTYQTPLTQPVTALSEGRHVVSVRAADWLGNVKEQEWSFVVNNSLRPRIVPRSRIPAGRTTEQPTARQQRPSYRPGSRPTPGQPQPAPGGVYSPGGYGQPQPGGNQPGGYGPQDAYQPGGYGPPEGYPPQEDVPPPPPPPVMPGPDGL